MAKNTQRLPDNLFTGRCDTDLGSSPLKQLDAQFVFQFSHGNTGGRLTIKNRPPPHDRNAAHARQR